MWNVHNMENMSKILLAYDQRHIAHFIRVSHFRGMIDLSYCINSLVAYEIGLRTIYNTWGFTVVTVLADKLHESTSVLTVIWPSINRQELSYQQICPVGELPSRIHVVPRWSSSLITPLSFPFHVATCSEVRVASLSKKYDLIPHFPPCFRDCTSVSSNLRCGSFNHVIHGFLE